MRAFLIVWAGQLVSIIGSGLTSFALGVWVFERTGSATAFAVISVMATVPAILLSPLAGAVVDRHDRRAVLIASDTAAALSTGVLALLLFTGRLEVWHVWAGAAVTSACSAFQWPAISAATTLLVPKAQLGRAAGLTQFAAAMGPVLSPLLAVGLVGVVGLHGVIALDAATFVFSVATLLLVSIPRPQGTPTAPPEATLRRDLTFGWRYVRARPGLVHLMVLFTGMNVVAEVMTSLFAPMVLSRGSREALGAAMSAGGAGMLLGVLLLTATGGPRNRVRGVAVFGALLGAGVLVAGAGPSAFYWALGSALIGFSAPLVNGASQEIWQRKVPPEAQGRVFALRRMVAWSAAPLTALTVGPLADRVFEPAMRPGGALSGLLGGVLGTGSGRGIALMLMLAGAGMGLIVLRAWASPRLRHLEDEIPDAIPDTPPAPPAQETEPAAAPVLA
ncbi:MAG TPA: MFS transporter [Longimicrobium sp.]|nr:MFS transporter [Longimicrobium sp.]